MIRSYQNESYTVLYFRSILKKLKEECGIEVARKFDVNKWDVIKKKYHLKPYPGSQESVYNIVKKELTKVNVSEQLDQALKAAKILKLENKSKR